MIDLDAIEISELLVICEQHGWDADSAIETRRGIHAKLYAAREELREESQRTARAIAADASQFERIKVGAKYFYRHIGDAGAVVRVADKIRDEHREPGHRVLVVVTVEEIVGNVLGSFVVGQELRVHPGHLTERSTS